MGWLGRVWPVRLAGLKGWTSWQGCWADWAEIQREKHFRIKIGFLNLPRLQKFAQ
jgi:hypothetical protein